MRKIKKAIPFALVAFMSLTALPLSGCAELGDDNVLRVASWDEYICEGGEDSYTGEGLPLYEEFEIWYKQTYGKDIKVEYVTLQDNETMYNKVRMGDSYDLLCPSEYMCMKLAEEGYLQKLPTSFFDETDENNHYVKNVSPYIKSVFGDEQMRFPIGSSLSEYVAGYMWGTTGFVYNPETVDPQDVRSWNVFVNPKYNRKISAKDNVRDSYFAGLGMYYEDTLLAEKTKLDSGAITLEEYKRTLFTKMNDTDSISEVQKLLQKMRKNLYGLETDEGKLDVITGRFDISYQWSGDAVYTLDMGESDEIVSEPKYLEYCIPDSASNLWFDGWVLMKDCKNVDAATAFINFLSIPENVVRNMYYIGYTSCIGGDEVFSYIEETYGADETEEETALYDLSYFFGEDHVLTTYSEQLKRQLFAQYPDQDTINRLVVMQYFDKEANTKANRMWNNIK